MYSTVWIIIIDLNTEFEKFDDILYVRTLLKSPRDRANRAGHPRRPPYSPSDCSFCYQIEKENWLAE